MKIQNLWAKFIEEITRNIEEDDIRDLAINFFNTEFDKKMEACAKVYKEKQQAVSFTGKKQFQLV